MELPPVYRRGRLLTAGYSETELRRLLRTGELTSLRRGRYLRGDPPPDPALRHGLAARAVLDRLGDGAVFSHVTAAVLHGLPTWGIPLERVHATRPRRRGGRRSRAVLLHSAALAADEITTAAGLPVTSLARTALDLARTMSFEAAVAVADAALHGQLETVPVRDPLDPAALSAALARAAGWPVAEKRREDRLRDAGLAVVRWTWSWPASPPSPTASGPAWPNEAALPDATQPAGGLRRHAKGCLVIAARQGEP